LVDSDIDPELVILLRRIGFKATHATWQKIPNDDTKYLIWGRKHNYVLVNHDKHRDAKTKYSFYSEMFYHGGRVIRVGKPGQPMNRVSKRGVSPSFFIPPSPARGRGLRG
jgi:hypothetical protein